MNLLTVYIILCSSKNLQKMKTGLSNKRSDFIKRVREYKRQKLIRFRSSHCMCSKKKGILKIFLKFTGKHLCPRLYWHRCFSVSLRNFKNTFFLTEHLRWLLLENTILIKKRGEWSFWSNGSDLQRNCCMTT